MSTRKDRVETLIEQEKWADARLAIEKELKSDPDNHWLLTRLSTTYYEEGDYERALEGVEKARAIAPNCPLVLWDYAGTLDMLGREREALKVYRSLLDRGAEAIADDECGEGMDWALSLLTDCVCRIGNCVEDLGDQRKAAELYRRYLHLLDLGSRSIYSRDEAATRLRQLTEPNSGIRETLERVREELSGA